MILDKDHRIFHNIPALQSHNKIRFKPSYEMKTRSVSIKTEHKEGVGFNELDKWSQDTSLLQTVAVSFLIWGFFTMI